MYIHYIYIYIYIIYIYTYSDSQMQSSVLSDGSGGQIFGRGVLSVGHFLRRRLERCVAAGSQERRELPAAHGCSLLRGVTGRDMIYVCV